MNKSIIGKRYAFALLDEGIEKKKSDIFLKELDLLTKCYTEKNSVFYKIMNYPSFSKEEKTSIIISVLSYYKIGVSVQNLCKMLINRSRLSLIVYINREYTKEKKRKENKLDITVITAKEIKGDIVKEISEELKKQTGKDIVLQKKVDPSLFGGIKIYIGGVILDNSLDRKLKDIKNILLE